jgi:NAD(P)H-dependent nitrite reductase small subunit
MATWIPVAAADDVAPGTGRHVEAGDRCLAVFNLGGEYYAIDGACPHQGGPLGDGLLDQDGVVTCPWHAWKFSVRDGVSPSTGDLRVRCYPVRVVDGMVHVGVTDTPTA